MWGLWLLLQGGNKLKSYFVGFAQKFYIIRLSNNSHLTIVRSNNDPQYGLKRSGLYIPPVSDHKDPRNRETELSSFSLVHQLCELDFTGPSVFLPVRHRDVPPACICDVPRQQQIRQDGLLWWSSLNNNNTESLWVGGGVADTNYLYPARWGWIKN